MLKKIIKYGAVAGVSYAAGATMQALYNAEKHKYSPDSNDDVDVWEGETHEITLDRKAGNMWLNAIDGVLQNKQVFNAIFAEDDLKDVRRKVSHGLSDLNESDSNSFTIEISDRQRLRVIEHTLINTKGNQFLPDEYR